MLNDFDELGKSMQIPEIEKNQNPFISFKLQ